ncbi:uncharacterized protein HD556DRAFT_1305151 [Suillus plorans]|uniref:Uncharacterized protein n=1 Tax=Suillus plorans TaxID=116603 RepID=A0A9P7DQA6_9AGAM|nr:uncharacterized protein HD556DRAFT_1305151 [Suillus plorans]KAG1799625.1 hypothetical protein EV424DRAFT_1439155 [Suillus variegatus]KAG1800383.1 hypothetical protein HD556DRAFT_1305151 [Suillus plorans]
MSESSHAPIHLNLNVSSDISSASRMRPRCNKWQAGYVLGDSGSGIADLYEVVDAIGSMTINDVDDLEANLIMDLARARRDVFDAEKTLNDCIVREHEVLTTLSKHKSAISKRKVDKADVGLGHMRITFRKHGLSHHPAPYNFHDSFASCRQVAIQLD